MATVRSRTLQRSGKDTAQPSIAGQYSLHAIAFLSGAIVLLLEVLASRVLAPFLGTSFSVWVNIIGTILAALSLGYYVGGVLADRNQKLLPYIFLVAAGACSFVCFGRPILPHLGALGLIWGSLFAAILFFAPASFILGTGPPYLLKIATNDASRVGRTFGGIFAASTLGSIAGTFAGGFWLIPHFPISYILAGIVVLLLGLSVWSAGAVKKYWVFSVALLAMGSVLMQLAAYSDSKHTVFEKNSQYYNIRVNDVWMNGVPYRWLLLDGSSQAARFLDNADPALPYTDLSMRIIRSLKPSPQSVLALGGGGYTVPELVKRDSPNSNVTVVEIDPAVTKVAKEFFLSDRSIPITTLNEDARVFLNRNQKQFDLVYSDVYSAGFSVPPALSSREAFQLMQRAMKPDGILVLNILSAREGASAPVYQSLYKTISSVFPGMAAYTTEPNAPNVPQNIIVIATNGEAVSEDALPNLRPWRCRTAPATGILMTDDYAPTDYLARNLVRALYPLTRTVQ